MCPASALRKRRAQLAKTTWAKEKTSAALGKTFAAEVFSFAQVVSPLYAGGAAYTAAGRLSRPLLAPAAPAGNQYEHVYADYAGLLKKHPGESCNGCLDCCLDCGPAQA